MAADIETTSAGSDNTLALVATNEYGEYDRRSLAFYGLEMLIEPHKETTITVLGAKAADSGSPPRFRWLLTRSDEDDETQPSPDYAPVLDGEFGTTVRVKLKGPAPATYVLLVQQIGSGGGGGGSGGATVMTSDGSVRGGGGGDGGVDADVVAVLAEKRVVVACKHVRRELRDLTQSDSTAFFRALGELYSVSTEEGKAKYGKKFANSKIMAAYHHSATFCYHNGLHFNNAHASFDLWAERSLQMIDSRVTLPLWDFTKDTAELGAGWPNSAIFGVDMFGSAVGSPENDFEINEGWFTNVTSLYDPDHTFITGSPNLKPGHNPYGFIDAGNNYQPSSGVARTASYCGLLSETEMTSCDVLIGCFEDNDNIYDWTTCMENEVHAAMHGQLGGGFNCAVDMEVFHEEHPEYTRGLLSYTLEYIVTNTWPTNSLVGAYNDCDMSCDVGQTEPCGCTCTVDPFDWSDDEVYEFMEKSMKVMASKLYGDKWVYTQNKDPDQYEYGFMQDGQKLTQDQTVFLLRQLFIIACEPGTLGGMAVGPSPLDPLFMVVHPIFEKALHVLLLSPTYADTYDFTWVDTDCGDGVSGGGLADTLPFTEIELGFGESADLLTNAQIQRLMNPSNPGLPYVYDKINTWGDCKEWDFVL
eukprot:g10001.t1